jgi:hypothetical protein
MLFKGPGSFKKNFKIGGNVDELKAYRLIQLTHPLFFHFTLPLNADPDRTSRFNAIRIQLPKIMPIRIRSPVSFYRYCYEWEQSRFLNIAMSHRFDMQEDPFST